MQDATPDQPESDPATAQTNAAEGNPADTSPASAEQIKAWLEDAVEQHQQGYLVKASEGYQLVLQHDPRHSTALQLSGVIHCQMGDYLAAEHLVKQSLEIDPNQPHTLSNLGNIYAEQERYEDSANAYERARELQPENAQHSFHLGHVYSEINRNVDALNAYRQAVEQAPEEISYLTTLGRYESGLTLFEDAEKHLNQALQLDPNNTVAFDSLGKAFRAQNRIEDALQIYKRWLAAYPDHPVAEYFARVCGGETTDRASEKYVKVAFDSFAANFDQTLQNLQYAVPELICQKAQQWAAALAASTKTAAEDSSTTKLAVVDLGCGTGLCGPLLRPLAEHLIGVDLSPNMLIMAKERQLYDELIEAELTAYLQDLSEPQDLLVSADTLNYIGDLASTFTAAAQVLRPGGRMIFSLERQTDDQTSDHYQLSPSGRFLHSKAPVEAWLQQANLNVVSFDKEQLRTEGDDAVEGYIIVAEKPA